MTDALTIPKWTKKAAMEWLRAAIADPKHPGRRDETGYGGGWDSFRGWEVDFQVYADLDAYDKGVANHDSLSDFQPWSEIRKWLAPGRVVDIYIFERTPEFGRGDLYVTFPVELPKVASKDAPDKAPTPAPKGADVTFGPMETEDVDGAASADIFRGDARVGVIEKEVADYGGAGRAFKTLAYNVSFFGDGAPEGFRIPVRTAPGRTGSHRVITPARTALAQAKQRAREALEGTAPAAPALPSSQPEPTPRPAAVTKPEPVYPPKAPSLPVPQRTERWAPGNKIPPQDDLLSPRAKEALRALVQAGGAMRGQEITDYSGGKRRRTYTNKPAVKVAKALTGNFLPMRDTPVKVALQGTEGQGKRGGPLRTTYAIISGEANQDAQGREVMDVTVTVGPGALYALSLPDKKEAKALKEREAQARAKAKAAKERAQIEALPKGLSPAAIKAAFEPYREQVEQEYRRFADYLFRHTRERFGPTERDLRRARSAVPEMVRQINRLKVFHSMPDPTRHYEPDPAKIDREAKRYAQEAFDAMEAKIISKVGGLEDVTLRLRGGGEFDLTGRLPGGPGAAPATVRIEQQRILKTSPLGKMFHQWPARIYVDGEFTPAGDYARLLHERQDRLRG